MRQTLRALHQTHQAQATLFCDNPDLFRNDRQTQVRSPQLLRRRPSWRRTPAIRPSKAGCAS